MSESTQDPNEGVNLEGPADGGADGVAGVRDGGADGSADSGGFGVRGSGGDGGLMAGPMVALTAGPVAEQWRGRWSRCAEQTAEQTAAPKA